MPWDNLKTVQAFTEKTLTDRKMHCFSSGELSFLFIDEDDVRAGGKILCSPECH